MNAGYVYVLTNPSMLGLVKIGKTTKSPRERLKELSSATGVPTPFVLEYYRQFLDCDEAERKIHSILSERGLRYNNEREFFLISPEMAITELLRIEGGISDYYNTNKASSNEDDENVDYEAIFRQCVIADAMNKREDVELERQLLLKCIKGGYLKAYSFYANLLDDVPSQIEILKKGARNGACDCCISLVTILVSGHCFTFQPKITDEEIQEIKESLVLCGKLLDVYVGYHNMYAICGLLENYIHGCLSFDVPIAEEAVLRHIHFIEEVAEKDNGIFDISFVDLHTNSFRDNPHENTKEYIMKLIEKSHC